jgi:DNA-binding MarR family transcriptional regulator
MASKSVPLLFEDVEAAWAREFPDMKLDGFLMGAVLMRMGRIVEKHFSDLCTTRFGIIGPEIMLLMALRRLGPPYSVRPAQLKRLLLLTSGAVTKQIDRLSGKGLVERLPDPSSLNGQLISLTDAGRAVTDQAMSMLSKDSVAVSAFLSLPSSLAEQGWKFCHAMVDQLEAQEGPGSDRKTPADGSD